MSWPVIDAQLALRRLKTGEKAIDLRSPGEFAVGHVPGFVNIAILNDEHRHRVGLTYKENGQAAALAIGHELVDPIRGDLVSQWCEVLAGREGLVCCWRGGLRSEIAADWLNDAGAKGDRIAGGYKAMRRALLAAMTVPRKWIVLTGLTGAGKTELLRELPKERVLDLEAFARHRGSAFGGRMGEPQPSQQTFENAIGLQLFANPGPILLENESGMIGQRSVPFVLRKVLAEAPVVRLEAPMEDRVRRIHHEYVALPMGAYSSRVVEDSLLASAGKIQRALGGARTSEVVQMIRAAFAAPDLTVEVHRPWIEYLLREYYDQKYDYGRTHDHRTLLFAGGYEDVKNFLADLTDRRGP